MTSGELKTTTIDSVEPELITTVESDALKDIKDRLGEISYMSADIVNLGSIAEIVKNPSNKDIWRGSISTKESQREAAISDQELDHAAVILSESFIETKPGAPIRCIHAGSVAGYDSNNASDFERPLGPQFPGGNVGFAIARGITEVGRGTMINKNAFEDDFEFEAEVTKKLGYTVGNHQGENPSEDQTGCGAVDGAEDILDIFLDQDRSKTAKALTQELLDASFGDDDGYKKANNEVFEDAKIIASKKEIYLPRKKAMLEIVEESNKDGVPKTENNTNTSFIVINNKIGTTLHTDEFDSKTDNNSKAFNLDLWNIVDTANESYEKENDRQRFIAASVALSISAAMTLTDGSLRLMARMPEEL